MRRLPAVLTAAAFLFGVNAAMAAEPLKLRIAWVATPGTLVPLMDKIPGLMKNNGVTYSFEPVYYPSSPTQITALAAGDLEIGALGFTSFPFAVQNAKLDLRIIAEDTVDGYEGYPSIEYKVRKDDPIKTAADLKGRALAVIGLGSGSDIALRTELLKYGLHYPADYSNLIEVHPPDTKAMLLENKVDVIPSGPPFMYDPELIAKTRTLFTMREAMGGTTAVAFWVVRADFLKAHRAVLVDLLEDTIRAYHWFADPANHGQAVAVLAQVTKIPVERLANWAFTKKGPTRNPDAIPKIAMIQRDVDDMTTLGLVKGHVAVKPYMDTSLAQEAKQRLTQN